MKKIQYFLMAAVVLLTAQCKDDNDETENIIPVTGISIQKTELRVSPGLKMFMRANIIPENATNQTIMWSSDNAVVEINDKTGEMLAKTKSNDVITITARTEDGGFTASCRLTVMEFPVTGIELLEEELLISPGNKIALHITVLSEMASNKNVIWTSDNPAVASVNAEGEVTGVNGPGIANIKVTTEEGGFTQSCVVKVTSDNLLRNGGFEDPDTNTAPCLNWENVSNAWFNNYPGYEDYTLSGFNNPGRVNDYADAFMFTGNGAFFGSNYANVLEGKYCVRIMVNNAGGLYQLIDVKAGKKYWFSIFVGFRLNSDNESFKSDETVKILSPDGMTTYHLEPVVFDESKVFMSNGNRPAYVVKVEGTFTPDTDMQVRFQFDQRHYPGPNSAPLCLFDNCEFREMPE